MRRDVLGRRVPFCAEKVREVDEALGCDQADERPHIGRRALEPDAGDNGSRAVWRKRIVQANVLCSRGSSSSRRRGRRRGRSSERS